MLLITPNKEMKGQTRGLPSARRIIRIFLLFIALASCPLAASAQQQAIDARLERAQEFIRQQQLARAEAELDAVLRVAPREANAHKLLGVIRAQQQRMVEAEQLFLRAIKESPAMVGAYFNLSLLYLEQHKTDRALWALNEAAKLAPDEPDINYNLA